MKVHILFGPVKTGKTTRLLNWVQYKASIDGILAPIVNDKRHLLHLGSNKQKLLEAPAKKPDSEIVEVGKYRFQKDVFSWACKKLNETQENSPDWLIIDEIGPLELGGKGLAPALDRIIENPERIKNLVLVIRGKLVKQVTARFGLQRFETLKFEFPEL